MNMTIAAHGLSLQLRKFIYSWDGYQGLTERAYISLSQHQTLLNSKMNKNFQLSSL
jgi:hypothetical protein